MADDSKQKKASANKSAGAKKPVDPKKEKKAPKADKAAKAAKPADAAKDAGKKEKEKATPPPRPPADPRLKFVKKFHGKFLPKGPLRERHREILDKWNSGEDHGGVTVEQLKALFTDWKASRQKPTAKV